jgi:alkyl sulfatase BDS1-like metallo-beta-lactamase superfamily hydrolase
VAGRIRPLSEAASPVPDLLALSSAIIDGTSDEPASRVTLECSEVADGIAMVESFSNVVALDTDDGLVLFDTSLAPYATKVLRALRGWSSAPVHTVVYTHGHVDHVGGAGAVVAEALDAGRAAPTVIAHEAVTERFARYRLTRGYNGWINARQFGGTGLTGDDSGSGQAAPLFPANFVEPDRTYTTALEHTVGGWDLSMHHGRGETDDHTWTWLADRRAVAVGDLFIWCFPNAGNPQKVQRYPADWAAALRRILSLRPELLLPAHGLPVAGEDRVALVLGDVAGALEALLSRTLDAMNSGAPLDEVLQSVKLDADLLDRPWLAPVYDEPEFVVRNIWRQYGGWYDGTPSRLKPAPDEAVGTEWVTLAGGTAPVVARALALCDAGDDRSLRLACHLIDGAAAADPTDPDVAAAAAAISAARRATESSLMARGIFGTAAADARRRAEGATPDAASGTAEGAGNAGGPVGA